ncbi:hypothetical protein LAZ67_3000418 [Cordylochernes scorpioides]|uniref:Uncharacterized protein n=1 Tax=Cordylochernes scorpioides TaxID=51811 RepID=A0ABY6K9I8_9ARAC|nr:hypothetical protein LAZ67_3000418 [Cordylochernes scorpioides]
MLNLSVFNGVDLESFIREVELKARVGKWDPEVKALLMFEALSPEVRFSLEEMGIRNDSSFKSIASKLNILYPKKARSIRECLKLIEGLKQRVGESPMVFKESFQAIRDKVEYSFDDSLVFEIFLENVLDKYREAIVRSEAKSIDKAVSVMATEDSVEHRCSFMKGVCSVEGVEEINSIKSEMKMLSASVNRMKHENEQCIADLSGEVEKLTKLLGEIRLSPPECSLGHIASDCSRQSSMFFNRNTLDNAEIVNIRLYGGNQFRNLPIVKVNINGNMWHLLYDTGSQVSIIDSEKCKVLKENWDDALKTLRIVSVTGQEQTLTRVKTCRVGNENGIELGEIRFWLMSLGDKAYDGILGINDIRRFNIPLPAIRERCNMISLKPEDRDYVDLSYVASVHRPMVSSSFEEKSVKRIENEAVKLPPTEFNRSYKEQSNPLLLKPSSLQSSCLLFSKQSRVLIIPNCMLQLPLKRLRFNQISPFASNNKKFRNDIATERLSRQDSEMELNQDPIGVKSDGPTETMERRQEARENEGAGERQEVIGRETTAPLADAVNQLSTLLTRAKISDGAESAIPPFDGTYSATQFFQTFDRKMEDASMGEQEKLLRLPNYLVRQPLELFRKLRLADRSYFQVRQILLDLYPESSEASFAKYFAMKLTGQANLETYYREKTAMGLQLGLPQEVILETLTEGLPFNDQRLVRVVPPENLGEWFRLVQRIRGPSVPATRSREDQPPTMSGPYHSTPRRPATIEKNIGWSTIPVLHDSRIHDSETTQQASEWRFKNEPRPKKARKAPNKVKVMLTVFFDYQGIVHHEFQQQGSTITADSYLRVLRRLREAIRQKRPELWRSKSWILHHDNAPAHTALKILKFLQDHSTSVFPQPPYSPDLAPCDFLLFEKLKKKLKGRKFQSIEEIKVESNKAMKAIPKTDYQRCFADWEKKGG